MLKSMGYPGESHHWTGDGTTVVIDLGNGQSGEAAAAFRPDVLVLTHSDVDHIGGSDLFFDDLGQHPGGEIWMPYEWAVLIDTAQRVSAGLAPSVQHPVDANAIEAVAAAARVVGADEARRDERLDDTDAAGRGIRLDEGAILNAVERAELSGDYLDEESWTAGETFLWQALTDRDRRKVARAITDKTEKLAGILVSAVRAGMTVRWFSVDHAAPGGRKKWEVSGEPGAVSLINAVEVEVGHVALGWETGVLFMAVRYTVQNRRALATLLWETADCAHFVVWSDGDGTACRLDDLPWQRIGGMTAPHHGSDKSVHDPIWQAAAPYLGGIDLLLAGGSWNQGLHPAFEARVPARRACTSCGWCRSQQVRGLQRAHGPAHAEVIWPVLPATCATECACLDHPRV